MDAVKLVEVNLICRNGLFLANKTCFYVFSPNYVLIKDQQPKINRRMETSYTAFKSYIINILIANHNTYR